MRKVNLDEYRVVVSRGLNPYADGSGFEIVVSLYADGINIKTPGDGDSTIAVDDWETVRDAIDEMIRFAASL